KAISRKHLVSSMGRAADARSHIQILSNRLALEGWSARFSWRVPLWGGRAAEQFSARDPRSMLSDYEAIRECRKCLSRGEQAARFVSPQPIRPFASPLTRRALVNKPV